MDASEPLVKALSIVEDLRTASLNRQDGPAPDLTDRVGIASPASCGAPTVRRQHRPASQRRPNGSDAWVSPAGGRLCAAGITWPHYRERCSSRAAARCSSSAVVI
jgi:hypothetical protein